MTLMCSNEKIDNLSFEKPPAKAQKADLVAQIDGVLVVRLANGRFVTSARDFHKWAYTVGHDLLPREGVIRGLAAIGFITEEEADQHMAEHRRVKAASDDEFAEKMVRAYADRLGIAAEVSAALVARTGAGSEA